MFNLSQLFVQVSELLRSQGKPRIQNAMADLESDWQGVSRQHYEMLYQEWQGNVEHLMTLSETLGRRMQHCAQALELADQ